MKQTAVEQVGIAFREWQRKWYNFDKTGKNKPVPFDEFISPFLEMKLEKQSFEEAARPLMEYLGRNHRPQASAHVRSHIVELLEGPQVFATDDYIFD